MNNTEIVQHLFSLSNKGIKYDLNRMSEAVKKCGNPQFEYKCFHIAGSNGKGSTCAYLESMLISKGFKTALYTSPHILKFEERFRINGKCIDQQQWLDVYKDLKNIIDCNNLTFFEATTLISFELFKRNSVDWAVFETGLGGRLDATNLVKPQVSIITNIALDHTDLLGKDLISIAKEKAGIIKNNIPAVVAFNSAPEVLEVFREYSQKKSAQCSVVYSSDANEIKQTDSGMLFCRKGFDYKISMNGKYQIINALLAIEAMERACVFAYAECAKGLSEAFIPCRFQQVTCKGREVILDVGHNPDAADAFVSNIKIRFPGSSICIVTGIMKDKDYPGIISNYMQIADTIFFTRPQIDRASKPEDLKKTLNSGKIKSEVYQRVSDAVTAAFKCSHDIICIVGSFYTVGEACECLGIDPFIRS